MPRPKRRILTVAWEGDASGQAPASGQDASGCDNSTPWVHESFQARRVSAARMDSLWEQGWRHFGCSFTRYSRRLWSGRMQRVWPLRVVLADCYLAKSQRRILRRNADLEVRIQKVVFDAERTRMFERHKLRFTQFRPRAIQAFLGPSPNQGPCRTFECAVYKEERLLAVSYLDVGREAVSSVYAMFDPAEAKRSLGIATMLWEMEYARKRGCRFYYMAYVFELPSELDYKKQFHGTEWFDWQGRWQPLPRVHGLERADTGADSFAPNRGKQDRQEVPPGELTPPGLGKGGSADGRACEV